MIYETTIRRAMLTGALRSAADSSKRSVISAVSHNADAGSGMKKVPDWNAHLSLRTYTNLKAAGVMQ